MLHTVPIFYDKYQDKGTTEACKQYQVLDAKVLSMMIPRGPAKPKKQN
nr:unnamed protein product [Digitaria exilis]